MHAGVVSDAHVQRDLVGQIEAALGLDHVGEDGRTARYSWTSPSSISDS